jgi:alkylation response protein AidB-like acyl-CoA dehydrogenase
METRQSGISGLEVSALGLGCMGMSHHRSVVLSASESNTVEAVARAYYRERGRQGRSYGSLRSAVVGAGMTPEAAVLVGRVRQLVAEWKPQRVERQARRHLERADFDALRETGFLRSVVPEASGGTWVDGSRSAAAVCETVRLLATADPAVALVSAMHPAVIGYWLFNPEPSLSGWEEQRHAVFASACAGERWGTITSEPGSGGDIARTKATASPSGVAGFMPGHGYLLAGDKHFGSGSGIADRMITTAVPAGEDAPAMFVLDVRDRPWDGTAGLTLIAEWDGVGMAATQSHAMRLEGAPGVRLAREGNLSEITTGAGPFIASLFTAVIIGVLDEVIAVAREQLRPKASELRSFEQVEWTRAVSDHWLAVQAYEGALRALPDGGPDALFAALTAKESVAELAERILSRVARVIGGGAFSQRSPFAHWYEDVRALGFLRPPWGLAYDNLFALSFR